MLPDDRVERLPVPFAAVALDLNTGHEVLITEGRLRAAVAASSAIPGVLPPVVSGTRLLVDGGWVDKIPVLPAYHLGADLVVAVDITADPDETRPYHRGIDVIIRANAIRDAAVARLLRRLADVVITRAVVIE